NAFSMSLFPAQSADSLFVDGEASNEENSIAWAEPRIELGILAPGQLSGVVVDQFGAVMAGAQVTVTSTDKNTSRTATTDQEGRWALGSLASGPVRVSIESAGFKTNQQELNFDAAHASTLGTTLQVATTAETVTIVAEGQVIQTSKMETQQRKQLE